MRGGTIRTHYVKKMKLINTLFSLILLIIKYAYKFYVGVPNSSLASVYKLDEVKQNENKKATMHNDCCITV